MKALVHLLLLFGVLIGLATQDVARAAESCPMEQAQTSAMAGMEGCCPHDEPTGHDGAPCKDMTLACLPMAGCATLGAFDPAELIGVTAQGPSVPQFWVMATTLHGWSVPPDIHPPARLG